MKVFTLVIKKRNKVSNEMEVKSTQRFLFDRRELDEIIEGLERQPSFQKGKRTLEVFETEEESKIRG